MKSLRKHWKYLVYLSKHKYWVYVEGRKRGLFWRVIWHDMDKFTPEMWMAYATFFNEEQTPEVKKRFRNAWRGHANRNDHHYQHWIATDEKGQQHVHEMSDVARREMLADWISANRTIAGTLQYKEGSDIKSWYNKRRDMFPIGPQTLRWLDKEISKL